MEMPPLDFDYEPKPKNRPTYTWSEVWTAAITKPRVETYEELLRDTNASPQRAYIWLFLTTLAVWLISTIVSMNDPQTIAELQQANPQMAAVMDSGSLLVGMLCIAPFIVGLSLAFIVLIARGMQFVANQIGPLEKTQGRWQDILYIMATIAAPMNIVSLIFVFIPIPILPLIVSIYQIYLYVLGIRAIFGFRTTQALMVFLVPPIGLFIVLFALMFCFLSMTVGAGSF